MRLPIITLILLTFSVAADASDAHRSAIAAALADPTRSAADRERDARDRPDVLLGLAGFAPGMRIADIFGGGGYYSEILDDLVGPQGKVLLINNPAYDAYARKDLDVRLANHRLANVDYRIVPNQAMGLGENALDGALIVLSYHDLYVDDPQQGWPLPNADLFIDQIVRALKPGAALLIVDHSAKQDTGKTGAQSLHRIDEAFAIADFNAHGLKLEGKLDVLRNPEDDRAKNVFDSAIRGKTDRFVHVYRKPR